MTALPEELNEVKKSNASSPILNQLRNLDRDPFMVVLRDALEHGPDGSDFKRLAKEKPKDWAITVNILAKLSGFSDKKEISQSVLHRISNLTDEQLEELANKAEKGEVIDVTDYEVHKP